MKKLSLKFLVVIYAMLIGNHGFSQTNLIINSSFETGSIPDGESDLPTYWGIGFQNRGCSTNSSPDCFDSRSSNALYDVPVNKWTTGRTAFHGERYVGFVGGVHATWLKGQGKINDKSTDPLYGENVYSPLLSPIQANCLYKIRFYAFPILDNLSGNWKVNTIHNKIEVVFYKEGVLTSCPGWVPFTSQSITNYGAWTLVEGFFTAPADIGALGLDKIEIRMKPRIYDEKTTPNDVKGETGVFIDSLSLYNISSAGFTPTSGFSFTTHTFSGSNPQASAWSGKNILIENELIVNSNLTINSSSIVKMGTNAKITVKSPFKLTIDNSKLSGKCFMWQGIVVESGAKLEMTNSHLYDAIRGIKVTGTTSEFLVANNYFDMNWTHMELDDCKTDGTSNAIYGNSFFHVKPLRDPSITATGKGYYGMRIYNIQSGNIITVGNTTYNENYFSGGQVGIQIQASNVDIKKSRFGNMPVGIKALQGGSNLVRTINVTNGCNFVVIGTGISAQLNYNLNVFGNTFSRCTNDGIKWLQNADKKLNVGNGGSGNGNTFAECKPAAVNIISNKTLKSSQDDNAQRATEIRVEGNTFTNSPTATGVLVYEAASSLFPHYKKLDVSNNTFSNIGIGIRFLNITGLEDKDANKFYARGIPFQNVTSYSSFTGERIASNVFSFTNRTNPEYIAIRTENTRGVQFHFNNSSHVVSADWKNKGIWLDNSTHSRVTDNTIQSGVGILAAGNMLQSNFMCNDLNLNVTGIQLISEFMRSSVTDLHGKVGGSDQLSRHNYYSNATWTEQNIELFNSGTTLNKWVYSPFSADDPNVKQNPGKIPRTSDLFGGRATSSCENLLEGEGDGDADDFSLSFSNLVMNWNYQYYCEKTFAERDTLIATKNSTIADIIEIEHNIDTGNLSNALDLLGDFTPTNTLETNYAYLLEIRIEMLDTAFDKLDSAQFANVNAIAGMQTRVGGIPVSVARAILLRDTGIEYAPIDDDYYPTIQGKFIDSLACIPDTLQGIGVALVDENFNKIDSIDIVYTNINGEFGFNPYAIKDLDSNMVVGFITWPSTDVSILNPEFKPIYQWIDSVNRTILTTGVYAHVLEDGSSPAYVNDTVIIDAYANIYTVTNGGDNFVVSQSGAWSKVYNGHMNSYDKAIGIMKHDSGNLYVVTNIVIDGRKGFEVWCIDTAGNLKWKKTQYDTIIEYEANGFDTTMQEGIRVAATVNDGLGGDIEQLIEINTCQSFMERYVSPLITPDEEEEPMASYSKTDRDVSIKVIPNPNQGSFNIQINNISNNSIFELYNLQGVKVYEKPVKAGMNKIQLPLNTSKGIYIGKITNTDNGYQLTIRIAID